MSPKTTRKMKIFDAFINSLQSIIFQTFLIPYYSFFQITMNSIAIPNGSPLDQSVRVDFQYFIQSSVDKKLSWDSLAHFLTDLAPDLEKSRQVIQILVLELEKWVSKFENQETEGSKNNSVNFSKEVTDHIQNNQNYLASPGFASNEDDSGSLHFKEKKNKHLLDRFCESKVSTTFPRQKKEYKCSICNRVLISNSKLVDHERIHSGLKPYHCNTCNKSFARKINLSCHEKIHKGEKPFRCTYCEKRCNRLDDLKTHERIHTGEMPFQCKHCEKFFKRSDALTKHERYHTREKPYKCKTCGKCFMQLYYLKKHELIHIGK